MEQEPNTKRNDVLVFGDISVTTEAPSQHWARLSWESRSL